MSRAHHVVKEFGRPRIGEVAPTLFIGPSRFHTLEVLALISPPTGVRIFPVMRFCEPTRLAAGYEEECR